MTAGCSQWGETATDAGFREGQPLPEELAQLLAPDSSRPVGQPLPPTEPVVVTTPAGPVVAFMVAGWPGPDTVFVRAHSSRPPHAVDPDMLVEHGLSPRQGEVALLLADGQTNPQIASRLGISVGTVKKHCRQIFAVLEVDNRAAAAAMLARMVG